MIYDEGYFYSNDNKKKLELDSIPVTDAFIIEAGKNYELVSLVPSATFVVEGVYYRYDKGMTWDDFIVSDYNTLGVTKRNVIGIGDIIIFSNVGSLYYKHGLDSNSNVVIATDLIQSPWDGVSEIMYMVV